MRNPAKPNSGDTTDSSPPSREPAFASADAAQRAETLHPDSKEDAGLANLRHEMVETQVRARGIEDENVLRAMQRVPRHEFVAGDMAQSAYDDCPQRIGHGQTISQPYIVALMTELAHVNARSRVLDVGTGSGYQAAILGEICAQVYSVEIVGELAEDATRLLARLGYDRVFVRCGDGYRGWPEHAPFDAIIVAAAPDHVPPILIEQLAVGGRLIIPVGDYAQDLWVIEKRIDGTVKRWTVAPVAFVPMTGEARQQRSR